LLLFHVEKACCAIRIRGRETPKHLVAKHLTTVFGTKDSLVEEKEDDADNEFSE
jgi:hypothetical protein